MLMHSFKVPVAKISFLEAQHEVGLSATISLKVLPPPAHPAAAIHADVHPVCDVCDVGEGEAGGLNSNKPSSCLPET